MQDTWVEGIRLNYMIILFILFFMINVPAGYSCRRKATSKGVDLVLAYESAMLII